MPAAWYDILVWHYGRCQLQLETWLTYDMPTPYYIAAHARLKQCAIIKQELMCGLKNHFSAAAAISAELVLIRDPSSVILIGGDDISWGCHEITTSWHDELSSLWSRRRWKWELWSRWEIWRCRGDNWWQRKRLQQYQWDAWSPERGACVKAKWSSWPELIKIIGYRISKCSLSSRFMQ